MNALQSLFNTAANTIWGLSSKRPGEDAFKNVKLVAHRGVHENALAKENSQDSFRLAIENQIWGFEFDVRWTKDDIPVVIHDLDCRRMFNLPHVIADTTFADLRKDVPQILSLEDVIQQFSQKIVLMIELKESLHNHPVRAERLEKILSRLIPRKHFYLLALDPQILESVSFVTKKAMMNVAFLNMGETLKQTLHFGHGALSGPFSLLTASRLRLCKERGIATGTGFIESRGALYREINRGVDMIFTNTPLQLKSYLQNP